jgi:GTPase SAR1 family protein
MRKPKSLSARRSGPKASNPLVPLTRIRTLEGHNETILSITFNPQGTILASGSSDGIVKVWEIASGELLHTLEGHQGDVYSLSFNSSGTTLASGSEDSTVRLWDVKHGTLVHEFVEPEISISAAVFHPSEQMLAIAGEGDSTVRFIDGSSGDLISSFPGESYSSIHDISFDATGNILACAKDDGSVVLWHVQTGELLSELFGHTDAVLSVAFDYTGQRLASGGTDGTVKLWHVEQGKLLRSLEVHKKSVDAVAFSPDGSVLCSKSADGSLRVWDCSTWNTASIINDYEHSGWVPGLAFHPKLPVFAVCARPSPEESSKLIHLWELDVSEVLRLAQEKEASLAVHHTTAKIVLVGESGVGKTGLGWRLKYGEFKEHASSHGQQFWVLDDLGTRRADGTECEAILWDLAGQPDYRLTHALFLDDADLALVVFDPTDSRDPLHGVEFWLNQLNAGRRPNESACPIILIGGRSDRGDPRLTADELDAFCLQRGIGGGYLSTSAKENIGLHELLQGMQQQIQWDQKSATVTTATFKRIKNFVLSLKESRRRKKAIVSPQQLRNYLAHLDAAWEFSNEEMMRAVRHLANYGYVRVLRTSGGERILLEPDLLNNLAASFVLEARRNPKGLGALEEKRLLAGEYKFQEIEHLSSDEREILIDAAVLLFIQHNICFRETDPLNEKSFLIFPELINLKKPILEDGGRVEDSVGYTVNGAIENVYASLVVLLGYTQRFTRIDQWRNHAQYEMGNGLICGFRQEGERTEELDLVLYFGTNVGRPIRILFQGLFESFLARRNLNVFRYEPTICSNLHALNRAVVRERLLGRKDFAFCPECSEKLLLPKADEPIQLTQTERRKVDEQRWFAMQRTQFEQAMFQLSTYVESQPITRPTCFVSYAWGNSEQERWVEGHLATDLQKAGINVVLDRWENARIGSSVNRFIERIEQSDFVIVVGTPLYRSKYENRDAHAGTIVAAEVDLISNRLTGTERQKETVLPLLLDGEKVNSLPPLLHNRVYGDFRNQRDYFVSTFQLTLDLYRINRRNEAVSDLYEGLRNAKGR